MDRLRRLHGRRVLPDRHRRRDDPGGRVRRPRHRHRQARADHPRAAPAVPAPGPRGALSRERAEPPRDRDQAPSWPRPTSAPIPSRPCATPAGWPSGSGAELHLLHVLSEISPPGPTRCSMPVMPPEFYEENEERAQETLDRLLDPAWGKPARSSRPSAGAARSRRSSTTPIEHADRPDRDRHPRPDRALSHVLLGSVAERIVREAPCPVLTIRDRDRAGRGRRSSRGATIAPTDRRIHRAA